jgi:hypothetical protein
MLAVLTGRRRRLLVVAAALLRRRILAWGRALRRRILSLCVSGRRSGRGGVVPWRRPRWRLILLMAVALWWRLCIMSVTTWDVSGLDAASAKGEK